MAAKQRERRDPSMAISSFKDLYIDHAQDCYSALKQSIEFSSELHQAASESDLKDAIERSISASKDALGEFEKIIKAHDADPNGEHCMGMQGLIKEARSHALDEEFEDDAVRDAMIIAQYQRLAHYAIAGYGTSAAFAKRLGLDDDAKVWEKQLDGTYDGDRTMTKLAETEVNKEAAAA